MAEPMTIAEFAAKIKQQIPSLAQVPDDVIVRKVLERRPDLINQVQRSEPRFNPAKATYLEQFEHKMRQTAANRAMEDLRAAAKREDKPRVPGGPLPSDIAAVRQLAPGALADIAKTIREVVTPRNVGIAGATALSPEIALGAIPYFAYQGGKGALMPQQRGEDAAEAARRRLVSAATVPLALAGGKSAADAYLEAKANTPGSVVGARSRSGANLDKIEAQYGTRAVDFTKPLQLAQQAKELAAQGFSIPKPMTDFIQWIEQKSKAGVQPVPGQPGAQVETPPSLNPLEFKNARNFYTSLGEYIPWDQFGGKGGRMWRLAKQMRSALGDSMKESLPPKDAAFYQQQLDDYAKAMNVEGMFGPVGRIAGRIATYGSGIPHAWAFGGAGAGLGEELAGSMVRSVTGKEVTPRPATSESFEDMMTRRGPGEVPPRSLADQQSLVKSMRMRFEQLRASGDPAMWKMGERLHDAEDQLKAMEKAQWPANYQQAPQKLSTQGGAGANFTADQLAEFKKRHGIQ